MHKDSGSLRAHRSTAFRLADRGTREGVGTPHAFFSLKARVPMRSDATDAVTASVRRAAGLLFRLL